MAQRNEMARARLQAQLNKKKNEGGAVEALDKQREKLLSGQYTPALLLEYQEKLSEKFNGDAAVRPLLMSSVHAPLLEHLDDFQKFSAKFQEMIPKKKKAKDGKDGADAKAAAEPTKDEAAEKAKKDKEAAKKKEKNAKKKAKAKEKAAADKKDDKKAEEKTAAPAPAAAAADAKPAAAAAAAPAAAAK